MPKNKRKNDTNNLPQSESDIFFGVPEEDSLNDAELANIDNKEFEFIVPIDEPEDYATSKSEEKAPLKATKETADKQPQNTKVKKEPGKKPVAEKKAKKSNAKESEKAKAPAKESKPQSTAAFIVTVTLKLLLICAVVATMLAWVYQITDPIIKENEYKKKEAAISEFFPEKTSFEELVSENESVNELYIVRNDNSILGYCASVSPSGFGGGIKMMVGVTWGKTVIGVKVIEHSETAGVGTKALDGAYLSKYIGEKGDSIELGSTVDAYAGATVTSKAVNAGINSALSVYNDVMGEGQPEQVEEVPGNEMPEGTFSIEEALHGVDGFYGWMQDEHTEDKPETNFSPFEDIYLSKVKTASGEWKDQGFAAVITVENESGWAKIMIGTYYNTQRGVRFLDYEGDNFKALALDTEYVKNYILSNGENVPEHPQSNAEIRLIAEKAAEVLAYYPEYMAQVTASEEVNA